MMVHKLIEHLVRNLVDKPELVTINEIVSDAGKQVVQIRVAAQDLARVIGGEGRTFRALRTAVNVLAPGVVQEIVVDIVE